MNLFELTGACAIVTLAYFLMSLGPTEPRTVPAQPATLFLPVAGELAGASAQHAPAIFGDTK